MQAFSGISFARKSITKINTKNKTSIMIEQVKLKKNKKTFWEIATKGFLLLGAIPKFVMGFISFAP